ncbi:hypothetical protein M7I_3648 [Glarea lozoyensis 74030]|uniref:Uncharacterized protein n=1 Tax=Glarea lozoyensis (strain ATCC 74030 / MF5533) TaxID=1104152 RepID=H0EM22_GLAL7|nr:hypothetical protein M7I_3648 [Glarea lozoyensis 74030]
MELSEDKGFAFDAVLGLQHLWRIGTEVGVGWWGSVVVFLPRANFDFNEENARIAARAWKCVHAPPDGDEDEEDIDLWDHKHDSVNQTHGARKGESALPDWNAVAGSKEPPPFFAAEIEDLPRGAAVEWCVSAGFTTSDSAGVVVHATVSGKGWSIYQTSIANQMHTILSFYWSEDGAEMDEALADGRQVLGLQGRDMGWIGAYLDKEVKNFESQDGWVIPCNRIWDGRRRRVAGVLVWEGVVNEMKLCILSTV